MIKTCPHIDTYSTSDAKINTSLWHKCDKVVCVYVSFYNASAIMIFVFFSAIAALSMEVCLVIDRKLLWLHIFFCVFYLCFPFWFYVTRVFVFLPLIKTASSSSSRPCARLMCAHNIDVCNAMRYVGLSPHRHTHIHRNQNRSRPAKVFASP